MKLDGFVKGPVTTIFGLACMAWGVYGWAVDGWLWTEGGGLTLFGLLLVFAKEKIHIFIGRFFTALIEKFFGKSK